MEKLFSVIDVSNRQTLLTQPRQWFSDHGVNILIIIVGVWVLQRVVRAVINGLLGRAMVNHAFTTESERKKRADTLHGLINAVVKLGALMVTAVMVIDELGINTAPLLASAGVVGLALGVGAQSFIRDFVSGIFVISENQYRVGDTVELSTTGKTISGVVEAISVRTTILRDLDGTRHYISNGAVLVASNKTFGFSKLNELMIVGPETDIAKLGSIVDKISEKLLRDEELGKRIKKAPRLEQVDGYTDKGLAVYIRGTTTPGGQWKVKNELFRELQVELKKAKIKLI